MYPIYVINACDQNSNIDFTQNSKNINLKANIEVLSTKKKLLLKKD